jgi:hypothetical protein
MKRALTNYIQTETESHPGLPEKASMVDLLKEDANRFCSKEEAHSVLFAIVEQIKERLTGESQIHDLYEISVTREEKNPPAPRSIGEWIDKNRGNYFAQPTIETRTRRVLRHPFAASALFGHAPSEADYTNETVNVIAGFSFTSAMPFNHVRSRLEPRYPNLTPEECFVVPILSRTDIRLFWAFSHFEYVDWGSARRIGRLQWSTDEAPLRDATRIGELTSTIVANFWSFVEEPLRAKWEGGPAPSTSTAQPGTES